LPETVAAILACGSATCEGRILLPELGEPVRIVELARFLIFAAGNGSAQQIPIRFTGLRPGDKLSEELTYQTERKDGMLDGPLEVIETCRLAPADLDGAIEELSRCIASRDLSGLIQMLSSVVPEYVPSELVVNTMAGARQVKR
jgi:FlaA1/EpsC-like NDP-sugar epimerase